jgi:hypothetical protein
MFAVIVASGRIVKSKFKKINTHGVIHYSIRNSLRSDKFVSYNPVSLNITKYPYCTKQQPEIAKSETRMTNFDSVFNDTQIDKYPWTYQLIGAGTGIIAYSGVIALNDYLGNSSLVDIVAHLGCIYSFGHLIGLTDTNFRDFLNQTFLATGALIVIILFAFCYALINSKDEDSKDKKGLSISIVTNKE